MLNAKQSELAFNVVTPINIIHYICLELNLDEYYKTFKKAECLITNNNSLFSINPSILKIMRKLFAAFLIVISTTGAMAQILATANSPETKNLLKMSVSQFTRSTFQMGYERFVAPTTSFYLAAGLSFENSDYDKVFGIRTEAQVRFHVFTSIRPKESHRLYFAPYLMNQYFETEKKVYDNNGNYDWQVDTFDAFGGGMLFGWSFSFANRINLDIYTGGGIRKTFNYDIGDNIYYSDGVFDYGYSGIVPRLGIDIGFWF
jgi:hypothetical protein